MKKIKLKEPTTPRQWTKYQERLRSLPPGEYLETWPFKLPIRVVMCQGGGNKYLLRRINRIRRIIGETEHRKQD